MRNLLIVAGLLAALFGAGSAVPQTVTSPGAGLTSTPPSGFARINNVFTVDFTASLGTVVTLNGLTPTQTITGLLTTDQVIVQCVCTLPTGIAIGNAYVSASDTLSIRFVTSVLGNVVLGSLTYRVTVFR